MIFFRKGKNNYTKKCLIKDKNFSKFKDKYLFVCKLKLLGNL